MHCIGIDLHKQTISVCVVNQEREVLIRKRFSCGDERRIEAFFREHKPFRAVVEATSSYEWLFGLIEPLSDRMVPAHPGKLRVIAESTRKSDQLDAQVLAEFLAADRFVLDQMTEAWCFHRSQLDAIEAALRRFARSAPAEEAEARAILSTIPYVGPVTVDVVCSELGDVRRFGSQKKVCAYAGLAPGYRESAGKRKESGITKKGSGLLRWALVESAWRLVIHCRRWGAVFEALAKRRGKKRAIRAIARRLLCVMVSMLRNGRGYRAAAV